MGFSERMPDLRTSKGLSQRALGKQIGVSFRGALELQKQ